MELKEFVEVLKKNAGLITAVTIISVIVASVVSVMIPPKYNSSIDIYVSRRAAAESDQYYSYDGYYSTQSSVQYSDTVSGLFQSLQIVRDAASNVQSSELYEKSEKEPNELSKDIEYLRKMSKKITVEDTAPQVINVSFKHNDVAKSELWVTSLGQVVQDKVAELNKDSDGNFRVDVSADPLVEEVTPSLAINIIVSLMSGLLVGTLWAFAKIYFNNGK